MEHRQYLVLDSPILKDALELGSLVADYLHPTRDFFFDDSLKRRLDSTVVREKNVEELMTVGSSRTEQSFLRRILSTTAANNISESYELQSLECRRYELIQVDLFFREILSLPKARLWTRNSLKGHPEAYLLTGYRTFREGILRKRRNVSSASTIDVSVPALRGVPGMSLGWSRSEGQESQVQYQTHEEAIFAVSYRKIKLQMFDQKRNASLERGRDWLRPWTKHRARPPGHGTVYFSDLESIAEGSRSKEPGKPDDEFRIRGAKMNAAGTPTSSTPRTSSLSPTHTQNDLSARQDELHNRASNLKAVSLTDNVEHPLKHIKTVMHELVIEMDESEEVLQVEEVGISHDGDARTEIVIEDDAWPETSDNSPALANKMLDGVEDLFTLFIRSSELRRLCAKAVQVASKDVFEVALDHHLHEFAKDLHRVASTEWENLGATFVQTRTPLVAALITKYIYILAAKEMTSPKTTKEDLFNLRQFIEKNDRWLYQFNEIEWKSSHLGNLGDTDQTPPPWGNFQTEPMKSFILNSPAFQKLRYNLETFVAKQNSVRRSFWTRNLYLFCVLFIFLINSVRTNAAGFLINSVYTIAACLIGQLETTNIRINGGLLSRSSGLFSSHSRASFSDVYRDPQAYIRVIAPLFIDSLVSHLKILSRPVVRPGYRRIEWRCECGEPLYGDFDDSDPASVDALEERLHFFRPLSNELSVASSSSGNTLSALPQAHINPSGAVSRGPRIGGGAPTVSVPVHLTTSSHSPSPERPTPKKYLELCINYGKWERRLGEIDVSAISTDGELFRAILSKYQAIRGFRTKKLYLLEPVDIHFVQFSLEERYRLNIHEEPDSWPSPEELERKAWEYSHPPKIPAGTFLHYMNSKKPHTRKNWLPTMPKKLERKMEEEESQLPMGWGIHVIEGLNKSLVSWLFWMVTTAVFLAGTAWSIWKQEGVTVAPLAIGILGVFLSFLTSEFYKQLEK